MSRPEIAPLPLPPAGSGIQVEESDGGRRITLPRLYTQADLVVAVVTAALALWMAVWVREMATGFPRPSTLGLVLMGAVGVAFAFVAVSQGLAVAVPRVLEDEGDRLVLGRRLGVRTVRKERLRKADITAIATVRDEAAVRAGAAGSVWIRAGEEDHLLGRGLGPDALAWLEEAVRSMAAHREG